jgi:hypothetical protein
MVSLIIITSMEILWKRVVIQAIYTTELIAVVVPRRVTMVDDDFLVHPLDSFANDR